MEKWEPATEGSTPQYVYVPEPYDVSVSATDLIDLGLSDTTLSFTVRYGITDNATATVEATIGADLSLVDAYNAANSKDFVPLPEEHVAFPNPVVSITAGDVEASVAFKLVELDRLSNGNFLLPVTVKSVNASNGFPLHETRKTVYYAISNKSAILIAQWKFEDPANLGKATVGADLTPVGEGFASVAGPGASKAVRVFKGSYYRAVHQTGADLSQYTIMFDVNYPGFGSNYYTFLQTDLNNGADASLFIRKSDGSVGKGTYPGADGSLPPGVWNRVVISYNQGSWFRLYYNGELIWDPEGYGYYQTLNKDGFLLFADNDGEDETFDIGEVALWDAPMGEVRIKSLGGADNDF
jgi:hypothetical protein